MRTNLFVVCFVLGLALPAPAQEMPKFDVSGAYAFLRDEGIGENFHGWVAAFGSYIKPWGIDVVGEVSGTYRALKRFGGGLDLSIHSVLGGPRVSRRNAKVTTFAQILYGVARAGAAFEGETESETQSALQPGGGVDLCLRPNFGIRVGGDYRRILIKGEEDSNEFRFYTGVVLGAGKR